MRLFTLFAILLLTVGCSAENPTGPNQADNAAPNGLATLIGAVEFWEGDFMPMSDPALPSGEIRPVSRTLLIYEPTGFDDVVPADDGGGFFSSVATALIATTASNDDGEFEIDLPAGTYSVFVEEEGRLYANLYTNELIQPVTVEAGEDTEFVIKIDYAATY